MSNRKFSGNISGKGYYIALILCAIAIGITGYLYYRNANEPQESLDAQSSAAADAPQADVPVVATQPTTPSGQTQPTTPATQPSEPKTMTTVAPVSGETVHPYAVDCLSYNETTRDWRTHDGIDIAAAAGTAVCAAADGEVYSVYEDETMGMTVVLVHDGGYATRYSSLADNVSVKAGDAVTAGQTIGYVGSSALLESAIGDHVHFAVTCNGETVDPVEFLD